MNMKDITKWSITVALAGFLFGFDTVVISGANQPIKDLWPASPLFRSTFIMSMALWGTVVGSLLGGIPTKLLGRKKTLFWIGVLFFVSAIGCAFVPDSYSFSFFRFISGIGAGVSSVAAPIYISEIFPNRVRAYGQSWGTSTHWKFAAIITLITPYFVDGQISELKDTVWYIYYFFAVMMILQLLWALFEMPETKGKEGSHEELEHKLIPEDE